MGLLTRVSLCAVFCLGLVHFGRAQAQDSTKLNQQQDDELPNLKQEVREVRDEQRRVIDLLNEIKQLLTVNPALRPVPQPPVPPSALATLNQVVRGDEGATVAIVEYADFECPYCGQYEHEVQPQIFSEYIQTGKVKFFFRDLPLPMHPHAMIAARAAHCAGEQGKFWEMHDSLFANQKAIRDVDMPSRAQKLGLDSVKFCDCLSSDRFTDEIIQSAEEAQKMGILGTPTFFIGKAGGDGEVTNLKMIMGVRPYDAFKSVIDGLLAEKAN